MKIKQIIKDGPRRGEVKELSAEEKAAEAVKDAVAATAEEGYLCYAEGIVITNVSTQSRGPRDDDKKFANNDYKAKGHVNIRRLKLDTDDLFPAKKHHFDIDFEDVLDQWGMPDIKVINFDITA